MADQSENGRAGLYGLMAEFESPEALKAAARAAREDEGYRQMDAYTPFPVEGVAEVVGFEKNRVPLVVLIGGLAGAGGAFAMMYYATVIAYPINIGGRPLNSWPAYVPITFEVTILFAATAALVGMLVMNRLPKPYHPVFNAPGFERASQDRFFLCIEAEDERFDRAKTQRFLQRQEPVAVEAVRL
jgi:hypothetical protein